MILWELNIYEPSKENQPGDFYTELDDGWSDIAFIVNFTVNGHKYVRFVHKLRKKRSASFVCVIRIYHTAIWTVLKDWRNNRGKHM